MRSSQRCEDFNNWPNSIGFDGPAELSGVEEELEVDGTIPSYACGVLYRTGPSSTQLKSSNGAVLEAHHWFDGFAQVYRYQIVPAADCEASIRVTYRSRSTTEYGTDHAPDFTEISTFGQRGDPCQSFFAKVASSFRLYWSLDPEKPVSPNIGVVLIDGAPYLPPGPKHEEELMNGSQGRLITATTDSNGLQTLDNDSLETISTISQTALHPLLQGPVTAAHYSKDPKTGDLINYNLIFQPLPTYRVFRTDSSTGETEILATIRDAPPAYVHSMFITENYAVLCVWAAHYGWRGLKFLWTQNVISSLDPLDSSKECIWYIIDRTPARRGVIATYKSDPFFSFHTINAYEETTKAADGTNRRSIVADLASYEDLTVLTKYYYDNIRSDSKSASSPMNMSESVRARLTRFRLRDVPTPYSAHELSFPIWTRPRRVEVLWKAPSSSSLETPSVNPKFSTKKHRYVYGISNRGLSTFFDGVGKFDCETQALLLWSEHGHTPGEPIFVADPKAASDDEDRGVVLTVVLNGYTGTSYLLVLDAKTMKEIARAQSKSAVAFGFHGLHVHG